LRRLLYHIFQFGGEAVKAVIVCQLDSSNSRLVRRMSALEGVLALDNEVLAEQRATRCWHIFAARDILVLNGGRDLLHHFLAQTRIRLHGRCIFYRLVKHNPDDLDKRTPVRLGLRFVRPCDDVVRDRVEVLRREAMEKCRDLTFDKRRRVTPWSEVRYKLFVETPDRDLAPWVPPASWMVARHPPDSSIK
jgi:hypothetical protein